MATTTSTIAAGASSAVSLAAGYTLRLTGLGTAQIAPPGVSKYDNTLRQVGASETSFGPYSIACTVNVVAANSGPGISATLSDGQSSVSGAGSAGEPPAGWALTAALGDSLTAEAWSWSAGDMSYPASSWFSWAMAFSRGALWCPLVGIAGASSPTINYNRAVSGETAEQCRARVTELLALPVKPKYCALLIGTNNLTYDPNQTAASIAAAIIAICDDLMKLSITPILSTLLPRGNFGAAGWGSLTAPQITAAQGKILRVNELLRAYASSERRCILADTHSSILNYASPTSDPTTTDCRDGVHLFDVGGAKVGAAWWRDVGKRITRPERISAGAADVYSATARTGNLLVDTAWGAAGGTAAAGVSGTVPALWTGERFEGATSSAVGNWRARADGLPGYEWVLAVTGSDTGAIRAYPSAGTAVDATTVNGWSDGDGIFGELDIDILSGGSLSHVVNPYIRFASGSIQLWALRQVYGSTIAGPLSMTLRTPVVLRNGGGFNGDSVAQGWLRLETASGVNGSAVVRNPAWRRYEKAALAALTW